MKLVLVGKMSSGKTTTMNILNDMGLPKTVTDTTRKPREGEIDGIDYNFLSENTFVEKLKMDVYAEYTSYNASFGKVWYGSRKESYQTPGVIVLNPRGLRAVRAQNIPIIAVYLNISEEEMRKRLMMRGDSEEEINRRIVDDEPDFEDIYNICDYIVDVDGLTPQEVAEAVLSCLDDEEIHYHKEKEKKLFRKHVKRTAKKKKADYKIADYSRNPVVIKCGDGRELRNTKHSSESSTFFKREMNKKVRRFKFSSDTSLYDDEVGRKTGGSKCLFKRINPCW